MHTIFYHADCPDGFGAAYGAWRHLGDNACYRAVHHGMAWSSEDVRDRDVFILDFSFAPDQLLTMASIARSVTLIDHHGTARQPWQGQLINTGRGSLEHFAHPTLPLQLWFDLDKSGARLAWEHFHPDTPLPLAIAHIEDMDLWRFRIPGTRAFSRALRLQPFAFPEWDAVVRSMNTPASTAYQRFIADGEAIDQFLRIEIRRLADSRLVTPITLKGDPIDPLQAVRHGQPVIHEENRSWLAVSGLAINASAVFSSELGNVLADKSGTFGLLWQCSGDGDAKLSLRASNRVNVATIAENYGGGGHPNAAGCRLPMSDFLGLLGRA